MVVYENLKLIKKIENAIVTVGAFDGFHKGHLAILNKMNSLSDNNKKKVVISFDPHPKIILKPKQKFELLIDKDKKIELYKKASIDILILCPFDEDFSKISAKDFLKNIIIDYLNPSYILIGYDHHFGFNRSGNFHFLKQSEKEYSYKTIRINPLSVNKNILSSSLIRKLITNGSIDLANKYLGWNYELKGRVVKGQGRGKKINYPTANLKVLEEKQCIPCNGVYAITVKINGNSYEGMCNIGYRPTFDELDEPIIEVNIFHIFKEDFYGSSIIVVFNRYIREERKFNSINELIAQIKLDKQNVLKKSI